MPLSLYGLFLRSSQVFRDLVLGSLVLVLQFQGSHLPLQHRKPLSVLRVITLRIKEDREGVNF